MPLHPNIIIFKKTIYLISLQIKRGKMGSSIDLRNFQSGKGARAVEDAFARVVSGGKIGYKTVIEKKTISPKCDKCGRGGDSGQKFCPQCGASLFCPACNLPTGPADKYCSNCGKQLRQRTP